MSFKKNFFKNIGNFAIYNYLAQGFEFLATIILSRLLLPEEYGFVAIINIFAGFIQLFSSLGIGTSVIRSNYNYTYYKLLNNLGIWLGIALTLLLSISSYPIAIFFNNKELVLPIIIVSIRFTLDSITYIPYAMLTKKLKFTLTGKAKLWGSSIQIVITIILAYLGFSYWALLIPLLISPLIQYAYLRMHVHLKIRIYNWRTTKFTIKKISSLMGNLSLNNLIKYWDGNADKIVIGKFYTESDLGLYNRAYRFVQLSFRLVTGIFNSVLFPSLKKLMDEGGNVNKEYTDLLGIITLINYPLILILIALPHPMVKILWGENWLGVAEFLPYIGIIIVFNTIVSTMSNIFLLYSKEKTMFLINLSSSIINITLVIIGGLISLKHLIAFYTAGYLFFTIPLNIYFGFYKAFNFSIKLIIKFWTLKLIFGIGLLISIFWGLTLLKNSILFFLLIHLLYDQRYVIKETIKVIKNKILKYKK